MGIVINFYLFVVFVLFVWACLYTDKKTLEYVSQKKQAQQGSSGVGGEGDSFINAAMFLSQNE
tara:strand:- start:1298 stop:1486 length:189 start_codon:yes stop_codon:yes gene_type:complete